MNQALEPIRAAGGVVWRAGPDGGREVIMVHRPRHDDWTLPKGKLERGELPLVAAVREVWEETAIRPVVGARLPSVSYAVWAKANGRRGPGESLMDKQVDYWSMRVGADEGFVPGQETDVRAWLGLDQAMANLTYPQDRTVLSAFARLPALRHPVVLVRHGSAGAADRFAGPDSARALDTRGRARAHELVDVLRCYAPGRLLAATPERCRQTLAPLADALELPIEPEPAFDQDADPRAAAALLRRLAGDGVAVVVCSQGGLIPPTLSLLARSLPTRRAASAYRTAKGDGWVLSFGERDDDPHGRGGLAALDALAA